MNELFLPLCLDIALFFLCLTFSGRYLSMWHPLTYYYFFHGYAISYRAWRLYVGAAPMFSGVPTFEPIRPEEFVRGLLYADISLVAFVIGSLIAHAKSEKIVSPNRRYQSLSKRVGQLVIFICLPVGLFTLIALRLGGDSFNFGNAGGYVAMASMWPINCLCLALFMYGPRWYTVIPMFAYLSMVGFQGYHRFMLVLPLLYLGIIIVQGSGRRWPGKFGVFGCLLVVLLFPHMKFIGREFQEKGLNKAIERAAVAFDLSDDTEKVEDLFDQLSGSLSLTDGAGGFYYGATYGYAFTLPIPRELWPEKPGLNQHILDISTRSRPYDLDGRILTLTGDSYLNFGLLGVIGVPLVLAFSLTVLLILHDDSPPGSIVRYFQIVVTVTLIQVFRDGLSSIMMFGFFQNFPMILLMTFHFLYRDSIERADAASEALKNSSAFSHLP